VPTADKRQRKKENARLAREAREAELKKRRRIRTVRNAAIAGAVFVVAILIITWVSGGNKKKVVANPTTTTTFKINPAKTYTANVTTNFGTIVLALDTKHDPIGAGRFITLAKSGVYNGSRWHRIVKDFVIQGGAPGGDLSKSAGNAVVGELPKDHYPVGSLAAAKTPQDPKGTFDSQFFIVTGAQQGATLANDYARFGSVKSGMDVVKKIEALPIDTNQFPTGKATIDTVTITEK
jgi:cyclophilin family peptidyl-prolyl cis-trans isomerase